MEGKVVDRIIAILLLICINWLREAYLSYPFCPYLFSSPPTYRGHAIDRNNLHSDKTKRIPSL